MPCTAAIYKFWWWFFYTPLIQCPCSKWCCVFSFLPSMSQSSGRIPEFSDWSLALFFWLLLFYFVFFSCVAYQLGKHITSADKWRRVGDCTHSCLRISHAPNYKQRQNLDFHSISVVLERQQQKMSIALGISCHGLSRPVQIVRRCLFVFTLYNLVFKKLTCWVVSSSFKNFFF